MKKYALRIIGLLSLSLVFLSFIHLVFYTNQEDEGEENVVHVYDWYGVIPKEILKKFEQETGIHVIYDIYDSNDILEAKLFSGNCGYDIVFPSLVPYAVRQIQAGTFQPIDKKKLLNWVNVDPYVEKQVKKIDPNLDFVLPFYWGTTGFLVNMDVVAKHVPSKSLDSLDMLFDKEILSALSKFGISYLSEATDIYPLLFRYMGKDPTSVDTNDLKIATSYLFKIRPFIKRFSSGRFVDDILLDDVCVAQCWSGESVYAEEEGKRQGKDIRYIIPREGAALWVDVVAIPRDAPHPLNAHKFIDFLMRPENNAEIVNFTKIATVFLNAHPFVDPEILKHKGIFPPHELLKKCFVEYNPNHEEFHAFDRERGRAWSMVLMSE